MIAPTSQDLELVLSIYETGSITAAAERLHVTQSAASQRLSKLHDRLGLQLFERDKGQLRITRAGERMVESAARLRGEFQALQEDLYSLAAQRQGQLRISTQCYTCYRWLPFLIRDMRLSHPDLVVDVVPEATDVPYGFLERDQLDIALVSDLDPSFRMPYQALFDDELFAVMSTQHPLAKREYLMPEDFAEQTLLLYTGDSHPIIDDILAPAGVSPGRVTQVRITEAIVELARAGRGIAVIAGWAFEDLPDKRDLAIVRISAAGFRRTWFAVVNERCVSSHAEACMQSVRAIGRAIAGAQWRQRLQAGPVSSTPADSGGHRDAVE